VSGRATSEEQIRILVLLASGRADFVHRTHTGSWWAIKSGGFADGYASYRIDGRAAVGLERRAALKVRRARKYTKEIELASRAECT